MAEQQQGKDASISLAGMTFEDVDIKGLVINGVNVANAFAYLRKGRTSTEPWTYWHTNRRDGSFVGESTAVQRKPNGEVNE